MIQETWNDSLFQNEIFEREIRGIREEEERFQIRREELRRRARFRQFEQWEFIEAERRERERIFRREREAARGPEGWRHYFSNDFDLEYFKTLLSDVLPIELAPVQCCTCCTSMVAFDYSISLSNVIVAEKYCQVCALLLRAVRAVKRHHNDAERNSQIVREGSALKMGSEGPRILRLCSHLESSAALRNNIKVSFPVLPEPENPARFALLCAWLRWCDKFHDCNSHSETALPTRLLYVGDPNPEVLCLCCPKKTDRVKYIALSHCWGKLTKERKREFCTTDENIEARLKGFSFSELPKTFRDAVRVTRELDIQYLWIDSLCIIQWNQTDWEHEAKRMEDVFASAYCTIAATSAVDSEEGFLKRNVSSEYVYAQDASGRRFYICADTDDSNHHVDIDDFNEHVEKAPLNTRAWVMQERVLSRRTIHFSDKQMFWECGEGVYCETLSRLESSPRKQFFMLDPNFPKRLLESGDERTTEFVQFLLENYSKRDLTKDTDRCVALSGLEARIARASECESRYGIFERYRHRNLLWQRSDREKTRQIGYKTQVVPSWSWMAYSGGIRFMDIPFGYVDWNPKLIFTEHKHVFFNIFKGKERYALAATDIGVFRNCSLEQRDVSYVVLDSSKTERGRIWYDIESSSLHPERCVVVGRDSYDDEHAPEHEKYYILVVRRTSIGGDYRRIGVGWIQSEYVARQRLNVRVV